MKSASLSMMPGAWIAGRCACRARILLVLSALLAWAGCHAPPRPAATAAAVASPAVARKALTRELLDGGQVDFDGRYPRGMVWLDDGQHYLHRRDGQSMRVDALTDQAEPAHDQAALQAALAAHPDFDAQAAERLARQPTQWTRDRSAVLLMHGSHLYFYRWAENQVTRLTEDAAQRRVVELDPRGEWVGFVRDNNLYVIATRTGQARQLTSDGSETLLNGILDWVYQEEIYGRGQWRAYWFRDDGEYLAYLQLDQAKVPLYSLVDYMPHISQVERTRYPKVGDPLPTVRLGMVPTAGGEPVWADLEKYAGTDILIVRVGWAPDGKLLFSVQDREQRWLELNEADPATGTMRTLIRETSPAWTNNLGHPRWLADGSFLWLSEADGYRHIYHHGRDGQLLRRLTAGPWPVRTLHGCDARTGWVYFSGARESVLESHAYRVRLEGGEPERLTAPGSDHSVNFDPTFRFFFDTFSNVATPPQVALRHADGSLARVISANPVKALDEYVWSAPELLQIPNRSGQPLNVELIRPPDFDPQRRYPVLCPVYGGPDSPTVRNRWSGNGLRFEQYLAQQGYLIWRCDPYSATGDVAAAAWQAYRRLGEAELADLEDSLRWLIDQGYADAERIGIMGYSYGGYMAAYALTHSKLFKVGIAGALLSDWRNYDAIYTERYMQTAQNNPEGYERAGVSNAAENLHGRLLIVHGLLDDNVHFQNTAQLLDALQEHRKMFDLMVYPRDRHGIGRGGRHHRDLQLQYILEHL